MKTTLILAAAVLMLSAASAAAQPAVPTVSIAYADLNLATAKDAHTMALRIRDAAGRACNAHPDNNAFDTIVANQECVHRAIGEAVAKLGAPLVTAEFDGPPARRLLAQR